ncbi:MAG: TolC family protein [Cyclobacteriaceae bacterium]|nr:TolC family protein [Cyclobacteriaceae bacterium]
MKVLKLLSLALLVSVHIAAQAQGDKKWSLAECVEYAYDNNLTVKRSELNMEGEEVTLTQNRLSRLPTLNANIYNSWRWGRSIDPTSNLFTTQRINSNGASATSQFLIYNGSRISRSINRSEMNVEASYYDLEKAKNDVALDVVSGYLQVIFTRELLENSRFQFNTTKAQMEQTEKMVNAGSLPKTNLLDLQSQLASNEVDIINAENDANIAVLRLKQFLQIPAEEEFDIVTPEFDKDNYDFVPYTIGEVYDMAESNQPEIKSAELKIESAEMGIKVAKADQIPSLGMQGQFSTNFSDLNSIPTGETNTVTQDPMPIGFLENDPTQVVNSFPVTREIPIREVRNIPDQWADNRGWSLGFNISIPIFNNWQTRSNIQRAKIEKEYAEVSATETKNILRQTIETAYYDAQAAAKVYDAALRQVEALEESFRVKEKSYNLGATNYVDYQISSFNLFSARSNLVRSKFDYIFKLKVLDFYIGNPLTL